ncbi:uncharacterized protein Tco025E_04716 [Trypanosoma conorhini]|uniref:Uncharacterized protein n=1 Tax=Trypanosoma conorhini TaxID=83891 RepID=A0A3S5ITJ6_9TRYP|nr:uncharacterized protein Tco025E_04716 [Trypanosoma conorhini]RNF18078.1 hypothetical protein Tco025E_04716 [Trypanosoma conorhini]
MGCLPPGWSGRKSARLSTRPAIAHQQSFCALRFATSARVIVRVPLAAAAAAAGAAASSAIAAAGGAAFGSGLSGGNWPSERYEQIVSRRWLAAGPRKVASRYRAASAPATHPKTTQSSRKFPPRQFWQCTPSAAPPAQ